MKKILVYILIVGFMISCGGEVGSTGGNKGANGNNNASQGNSNNDDDPCDKPKAEAGETPPALPSC